MGGCNTVNGSDDEYAASGSDTVDATDELTSVACSGTDTGTDTGTGTGTGTDVDTDTGSDTGSGSCIDACVVVSNSGSVTCVDADDDCVSVNDSDSDANCVDNGAWVVLMLLMRVLVPVHH